jgi:MarR family transcriptional regulator, transcriptional regulator for hemolysin
MYGNSEDDLLNLLHDVAHLMRTRFDQSARAWGMTRAQCVVLMHLKKHPGWTQNEMANHCEIEPITVARLIDRLETAGYCERRPDPSDRRVNRLHLKPAAEPILERITAGRNLAVHLLLDDIAPEKMQTIKDVLLEMKAKLSSNEYNLPRELGSPQ